LNAAKPLLSPPSQRLETLFLESEMRIPQTLQLSSGRVACLCRRCPGSDLPNDDSAAVLQTTSGAIVLVVADGVGGCAWGYKASAIAVQSVAQCVAAASPASDLRPAILDGIENSNRQILELGIGAATTLAVVEIQNERFRAYQVGDSTSMVVGQRGKLKWKSTAHSPVGYAVEAGIMEESDALYHDQRHVVSNFVGSRTMHIEIGPSGRLAACDSVILGSDGLFDNLRLDEVIAIGRSGQPAARIEKLAELATHRMRGEEPGQPGKPDDLTVLLYTR
jgi:serine/threonine protein phosphatase PrpC